MSISVRQLPFTRTGVDLVDRQFALWAGLLNPLLRSSPLQGVASSLVSGSPNPAATGLIRLASADVIRWRNNANTADLALSKSATDVLTWLGAASLGSLSVSGAGSFGGALNMNSHLIDNVTDPASAQDAATKNYVDGHGTMVLAFSFGSMAASTTTWLFPTGGSIAAGATALTPASSYVIPFAYTIKAVYYNFTNAPGLGTDQFVISKTGAAAVPLTGTWTGASARGTQAVTGNNTGSAGDFIEIGIANVQVSGSLPPGQSEVSLWIQPT